MPLLWPWPCSRCSHGYAVAVVAAMQPLWLRPCRCCGHGHAAAVVMAMQLLWSWPCMPRVRPPQKMPSWSPCSCCGLGHRASFYFFSFYGARTA
eukprot:364944-Chlamydomonas_euryale.AAC.9